MTLKRPCANRGSTENDPGRPSRAAGGSLSVLKRHLSMNSGHAVARLVSARTNYCERSYRCSSLGRGTMRMKSIATCCHACQTGRMGTFRHAAQRLMQEEETPLTRIESRWRLVSPEDSWSLVGTCVTDDLLGSFETIAIQVLGKQDESVGLRADERLRASVMGTAEANASPLLRRGISETAAILGSGFGPVAKLCRARERAESIVRATLRGASWQRWVALGNLLPLLAEAAPNEFLAAIQRRPEEQEPRVGEGARRRRR